MLISPRITRFVTLGFIRSVSPYYIWSHKPIIDVDHERQDDVDFLQVADEELTHSSTLHLQTRAVGSPSLMCSKIHDEVNMFWDQLCLNFRQEVLAISFNLDPAESYLIAACGVAEYAVSSGLSVFLCREGGWGCACQR